MSEAWGRPGIGRLRVDRYAPAPAIRLRRHRHVIERANGVPIFHSIAAVQMRDARAIAMSLNAPRRSTHHVAQRKSPAKAAGLSDLALAILPAPGIVLDPRFLIEASVLEPAAGRVVRPIQPRSRDIPRCT